MAYSIAPKSSGLAQAGTESTRSKRFLAGALDRLRSHSARIAGGTEQVLASAVSMGGLIVLSRMLEMDAFGVFAAALGIALIVQFVHDGLAIGPYVVDCPKAESDRAGLGAWLVWHAVVTSALTLAFLLGGLSLLWLEFRSGEVLLLAAMIIPAVCIYAFSRRVHYHRANNRHLLVQTALLGTCYAGGLGLLHISGIEPSAQTAALIVALSYGAPGSIYLLANSKNASFISSLPLRLANARTLIASMGISAAVWQSSYASALMALSLFGSPAAVALFTVTRTLERPIGLIISTVTEVDMSRAVRALSLNGIGALANVVRDAQLIIPASTAVPMLVMLIFPESVLHLVYGSTYASGSLELRLRILAVSPLLFSAPLHMALSVLRDTGFLLRVNLLSFASGAIFLFACFALDHLNAAAATLSLFVSQSIALPFMIARYQRKLATPNGEKEQP